jgi:prepilin-type N-terminal cleavage/methylation domain-containing protein
MKGPVHISKSNRGFSMAELLVVLALGAVVLGGLMVTYGTISANRVSVSETVDIQLQAAVAANFYNAPNGPRTVSVAPHYGVLAQAEKMREQFHSDLIGAAAVFCLYRRAGSIPNPYRRTWFPFNAGVDGPLESPRDFYAFLLKWNPAIAGTFEVPANPGTSNTFFAPHVSIYITSFSNDGTKLGVTAIYEMDVIPFVTAKPWGYYASVRRYTHSATNPNQVQSELSDGYEVFFPPSVVAPTSPAVFRTDGFSPMFISFERAVRRSLVEDSVNGRDRFKMAAERPFYFVWWPDPTARNLATENLSGLPREARRAYNHMGGRTAFMFTVPMFPAL